MGYHIAKYQGSGNDILIVDDRNMQFPQDPAFLRKICHRNYGIGSDGVILLQEDPIADFRMVFFNPDASQVAMCGNGIRCLIHFLKNVGIRKDIYTIASADKMYLCRFIDEKVAVGMGQVDILLWDHTLTDQNRRWKFYCVNSGVPHVILFSQDLSAEDIQKDGRFLRMHPLFAPHGTNVSYIQVESKDQIHIRTYERGVEAETLACGTAAVAAAFVARKLDLISSRVEIIPRSLEKIEINFHSSDKEENIEMVGAASCVFQGMIDLL